MKQGLSGMLNLDTHIVIELLKGDLSEREHELVLGHQLAISDIVNWEIAKLVQLGRLKMNLESPQFREFHASLALFPITVEVALQSTQLDFDSDPADEIIAATSIVHDMPLLTRDTRILSSRIVPLIRNE
jgi:PIN domain nuclease of toxin-antitoxin system